MTALCLPSLIGADSAVQRFSKRKLRNLYGLFARRIHIAEPGISASRTPPFIERLWLPAYAVCVHSKLREKESHTWTSVDGLAGYFAFLDNTADLASRKLSEETFPPIVTHEQAEAAARKGLLQFILRQRGQFNKPTIDAVEEVRLYHFPVWVLYFHRFNRRVDIKVIDAYTGKPGGAKMRVGVLDALVAARARRLAESDQARQ